MFNYNRNSDRLKLRSYLLPPLITCLGMILIMLIKQIYPFGSMGFGYNDNMHQVVPMYSFIWDVLHGRASSVYSVQIGMGTDLSVMRSTFSLFSPFNLLLYMVPRNYIPGFISVMTIAKMSCMAASMYFFFNHDRTFSGTSYAFKVLFSVMYSFSGYVMLYASCFSPWMDIVAIFPIFMLSFNKILDTGNKLFYMIMTSIMLIINSRLAIMAVIYAVAMTGGYIVIILNKNSFESFKDKMYEFGKKAGGMLAATAGGFGIAAFVLVPCMIKIYAESSQTLGISQYIELLLKPDVHTQYHMFQNFMMIFGLAFAFAIIIVGILFYKQEKRNTKYILFSLAVTMLPIVSGGVERLWSIKTYQEYSMHFGFITVFAIVSAGGYFAGKPLLINGRKTERKIETNFEPLEKLVYILAGMVLGGIAAYIYNKIGLEDVASAFIYFIFVFLLILGCDIAMCIVDKGILCAKSCYVATAIEIFIGIYAMMGIPGFYDLSAMQSTNHAIVANHISTAFDIKKSNTKAVKNPDLSLGMNYSLILQRPAITSDFDSYNDNFADAAAFGYGVYPSGATDAGGTVFSDALLNITNVISMTEEDDVLYRKTAEADGFNLYSLNFTLPYGMMIDPAPLKNMNPEDWIFVNNAFFRAITGSSDSGGIAEGYAVIQKGEGRYAIEVNERSAVYIKIDSDINLNVRADKKLLSVPKAENQANTLYRADDDKRLLYLGIFENEKVDVILTDESGRFCSAALQAGGIEMSELAVVCNMMKSNSKLSAAECDIRHGNIIRIEADKIKGRDMLLLPITYDKNWRIRINDTLSEPVYIGNKMFIGIMLQDGKNIIELSYIPPGTEAGMAVSILTILMIIGIYFLTEKKNPKLPKVIIRTAGWAFIAAWNVFMFGMFILPVIADLINTVNNIFRNI